MRRGRILIFLVLIVVIGLALLYFAWTQFGGLAVVAPTQAALTEVYFAAQNIPQGTEITREMLGTFSIPPENVAEVMFTVGEEGALIGQTARFSLDQGVVITSSMVGAGPVEISGPAWAVQIPSGMVAAAIPTNRLALVGYGVADGAHVNLNACMLFVDIDPAFQTVLPNFTAILTGAFAPAEGAPTLSMGIAGGGEGSRQGRLVLLDQQRDHGIRNQRGSIRINVLNPQFDDLGVLQGRHINIVCCHLIANTLGYNS